jgi:hypothetical protein
MDKVQKYNSFKLFIAFLKVQVVQNSVPGCSEASTHSRWSEIYVLILCLKIFCSYPPEIPEQVLKIRQ